MPLANKNLNTVARLAMGTAMISVLAGCDGRFGQAFSTLVAPITDSNQTVETVPVQGYDYQYVTPGVPTYTEQSQSANVQTFETIYGPPVVDTAAGTYVAEQQYTVPSFNDGTVDVMPISAPQVATYTQRVQQEQTIFGGESIDTGAITYSDPVPSSYAVATVPSQAVIEPITAVTVVEETYSAGEEAMIFDTASVNSFVQNEPAAFENTSVVATYETSSILDSGLTALPMEQTYSDAAAPTIMPAPIFETPSANAAVQIISNEEASATFGGEALPPALPPVESSVFDAAPAALPIQQDNGGQFQVLPQTNLDTSALEAQETSIVEAMWNSLTTSTAGATTTMAPIESDTLAAVAISPAPLPKAATVVPVPVQTAALDNGPRTAPTPRQRPAREYTSLTAAPLPQPRPAYKKPVAMATTAGNYVSIGALPNIGDTALVAPKMSVDAMLPTSATEGNGMAAGDVAPEVMQVAVAKMPEPAAPAIKAPAAMSDTSELSGTSWRLIEVNATPVGANAELHFDGRSGFAGGQGPCNSYGGEFRNTGKGNFAMSDIFTTDVACPSIAVEKQYIDALENARGYKISGGFSDLTLVDESGAAVATFRAF